MADTDVNFHLGHRERLREKLLNNQLADYELFELLLSFVIPRRDVRPLARAMMAKYGGIHQIITTDIDELMTNPGIGRNTAIFIKTLHQVILSDYKGAMDNTTVFHDDRVLVDYCRILLRGKKTEEFHVLYLDRLRRLLADDVHSRGTSDWAAVYPREILKRALALNAQSVVLIHNHPTAGIKFSSDDIKITEQIIDVLRPVEIMVHDHYLVTGDMVYSARAGFLIK